MWQLARPGYTANTGRNCQNIASRRSHQVIKAGPVNLLSAGRPVGLLLMP
jgi:hypothetical protein